MVLVLVLGPLRVGAPDATVTSDVDADTDADARGADTIALAVADDPVVVSPVPLAPLAPLPMAAAKWIGKAGRDRDSTTAEDDVPPL